MLFNTLRPKTEDMISMPEFLETSTRTYAGRMNAGVAHSLPGMASDFNMGLVDMAILCDEMLSRSPVGLEKAGTIRYITN